MCSDRHKNKTYHKSEKTYYTTDNFFGVGFISHLGEWSSGGTEI
jgi:hypothetical protein